MADPAGAPARGRSGRSVLTGVLVGVGVAGFVDEVVFHQLLHWHHFYDRSTGAVGLVSDGLLHAATWSAAVRCRDPGCSSSPRYRSASSPRC